MKKLIKTKDEMKGVEQEIKNEKGNGANSFLGIEQGSGKWNKDVQVTMNPMRKNKALSWILCEHSLQEISQGFEHETSI